LQRVLTLAAAGELTLTGTEQSLGSIEQAQPGGHWYISSRHR
jgi:hypothetical protein